VDRVLTRIETRSRTMSRIQHLAALASSLVIVGGCTPLDRSRAIGNDEVTAVTLAQQVCSSCHGVTGNSASPEFPKLAGQQHDYLAAQLAEFKSHNRSDPNGARYMWGFARLSPAQAEGLASYFAGQRPSAGPTGAPAEVAEGARIFAEGLPDLGVPMCSACHGAHAEGSGIFPRLAGQHADYLAKQLHVFRSTDQRPAGVAMKQVAHALTDVQIRSLSVFLQGLSPPAQ